MGTNGPERSEFDELVDIERATALLQQRDPSQAEAIVAARMSARSEQEKRSEQLERTRADVDAKRRRRRRRIVLGILAVVLLGAAAVPLGRNMLAEMDRAEALSQELMSAGRAAAKVGFTQKEQWLELLPGGVSVDVAADTCSAVVAIREGSSEPVHVRIERGGTGGALEGAGGQIWCSCEREEVQISVSTPEQPRHALVWLSAPAGKVGGIEVLNHTRIPGFTVYIGALDRSCAAKAFATWSTEPDHGALAHVPAKPAEPLRRILDQGLAALGTLPADRAFAAVPTEGGHCYLAVSTAGKPVVSLRAQNGEELVPDTSGAIGWCRYGASEVMSLWRSKPGGGAYTVLHAKAAKLGGMTGLHELVGRLKLDPVQLMVLPTISTDDVVAALEASTVVKDSIAKAAGQGLPERAEHRVLAFSTLPSGSYRPTAAPEVPVACHPRAELGAKMNAYVCVQAQAQSWQADGQAGRQVAAQGKLPFWLTALGDVADPAAIEAASQLLRIARRLHAQGFEPTTVDGVRDSATGADVTGRVEKREIVAIGITKSPPWIHPLRTPETPATADPYAPIALAPGKSITLRAERPLGADAANRRVVVWRR